MPDGSYDSYIGLGVNSRPVYEGSETHKRALLPMFQMEWSNGFYISGMSAGWHVSESPEIEFGPLLQLEPGRTPSGLGSSIDTPMRTTSSSDWGPELKIIGRKINRLEGMTDIKARLLGGGFFNYRVTENLRFTNALLYGAGNNRKGLKLNSDLNYRFGDLPRHHSLSISLGVSIVNASYANSFFGVSEEDSWNSINEEYAAKGGVKDVHLDLNWNYSINSSWLVTSRFRAGKLLGSAKDSPLVEKQVGTSASVALAYRF